jgi:hypothetical protein
MACSVQSPWIIADTREGQMSHRRVCMVILSTALGFLISGPQVSKAAPQKQIGIEVGRNKNAKKQLLYRNKHYGFSFSLPMSWKGYRILVEQWNGGVIDGTARLQGSESGPLIRIRNPRWTEQDPYQDIPIMIFTQDQWDLIESDSLVVSAAPFGPGEIGRNATYVFAIPPRYNYADAKGQDEVSEILDHNPIRPLKSR